MAIMDILGQLAEGVFNGLRTDSEMNGVWSGFYIDKGIPYKFREGKGSKFFDGKENVRTKGTRTVEPYETDEEKTLFFQKYGFIRDMFGDHPEVMDYSHEYYEHIKGGKK